MAGGGRRYYYDIRFLLLPLASIFQEYLGSDKTSVTSSTAMAVIASLLAAFLLTTIRVNLIWHASAAHNCNAWRFVRCHGAAAISFPLIFSLLVLLLLPPSCFWSAYFPVLLISPWSTPIHSFLARHSYQEERQILLPVFTQPPPAPLPSLQGSDE